MSIAPARSRSSRRHVGPSVRRLLLVVPEVAVRTGGIAMVGRSLMRLFTDRASDGQITFRTLSIGGAGDDAEAAELRHLVGDRHRHFAGNRLAFSRGVLWAAASWADAVVFTHVGLATLASLLPNRLRPRTLTMIHGREVWRPLRRRHRRALESSDVVASISEFTRRTAREFNPWLPPVRCCPLGIPLDDGAAEGGPPPGVDPGSQDILVVGRMVADEPGKGHAQLIAALPQVLEHIPKARLLIAGGGSEVDELRRLARRSGTGERVVFTGYLPAPQLHALYRSCGVFAMPSRQDGFGLVYLEAMRAGLPCIASDADGGQEVVAHGETGWRVPLDRPHALADRLIQLLGDDALRRRFGAAGRRRFEERFTERAFHDRFWPLVEELTA